MEQPPVIIVIVHWGDINVTRDCLASLKRLQYPNYRILVIDNGTSTVADIAEDFLDLAVISLPENIGFSPAANHGIEWSNSHGGQYTWLLNNDAIITDPACLSHLVHCAQESDRTITTPVFQCGTEGHPTTTHEIFFPALCLTFHNEAWLARGLSFFFRAEKFISGAAMFINLSKAPQPFFDEAYFAYYEDLDLCLRLGESELQICGDAAIFHKVSVSTGGSLFKHYYKARNLVYFLCKQHRWTFSLKVAYWLLFIPMEARKYWRQPLDYLHTTFEAYSDGRAMLTDNSNVCSDSL